MGQDRPNIIFLMSDDHGAHAMGAYGNREIKTPNMDRLASEGLKFTNCYATSSLCMPSRASVMVGMYEYRTGCNFNTGHLALDDWEKFSYPQMLKRAGYFTGFCGKWGFNVAEGKPGNTNEPVDCSDSFDMWGGFTGDSQGSYHTERNPTLKKYAEEYPHVTRAMGAFAGDFIDEARNRSGPFCLSVSFKAPHRPHDIIDPHDRVKYEGEGFRHPEESICKALELLPLQPKIGRQYYRRKEWGRERYSDHIRQYYSLISGIDDVIGDIRRKLSETGLDKNTVLIYTSDNGYFCGYHGLQGKTLPYSASSRIPLLISDPRKKQSWGEVSECVAGNIDFAPTILEIAGQEKPEMMDGESLVPLLDDPGREVRDYLLLMQNWGWVGNDHNKGMAVVSKKWKYINWCYADENLPPAEELFDLEADPREKKNMLDCSGNSTILKEMQNQYDAFHADMLSRAADTSDYRHICRVFDRNLSWREKHYRGFEVRPMWRYSRENLQEKSEKLKKLYASLVGDTKT